MDPVIRYSAEFLFFQEAGRSEREKIHRRNRVDVRFLHCHGRSGLF
jgi:hypothetical protein